MCPAPRDGGGFLDGSRVGWFVNSQKPLVGLLNAEAFAATVIEDLFRPPELLLDAHGSVGQRSV